MEILKLAPLAYELIPYELKRDKGLFWDLAKEMMSNLQGRILIDIFKFTGDNIKNDEDIILYLVKGLQIKFNVIDILRNIGPGLKNNAKFLYKLTHILWTMERNISEALKVFSDNTIFMEHLIGQNKKYLYYATPRVLLEIFNKKHKIEDLFNNIKFIKKLKVVYDSISGYYFEMFKDKIEEIFENYKLRNVIIGEFF